MKVGLTLPDDATVTPSLLVTRVTSVEAVQIKNELIE